ncbi:DNA topoisomerase III [Aestuariirhabdus sp. Z084]|uniref:DNA topoisomerase III n=1 Tax=Aestuariirhabdus haliotis TaxID=2918751 RepID=UPI00201B365C|nr:DNA topoisomerase III [Aestuariirhabdus haliotis]MCL6415531.1 DNA topoisomerase III [Aestuariirhabdus haliotis]MCL6419264.1 DNA topoisomerase III [Aestuariirhabdus haliotis]
MKLYIAEKPSLGRAIAAVLPKPHRKEDGCIWLGNGDCVSWCIGHLLEQAEPEAYDPAFKQWQMEHLPIVPESWQLKPRPQSRKQLSVLRKLVKQADQLVHAGDPDREGQLLVDEVLDYLGVKGQRFEAVKRCLISDLNPQSVLRSLADLRPNKEFMPLSVSALARSRADWLYGINMTRATTLQGRKVGFQGLLSVGRVQTPVLGLVVQRDAEIEHFQSKAYFEVWAQLQTATGDTFNAKWLPSEACRPHQDEEGRVLNRSLADNVVQRIQGQTATVESLKGKEGRQLAPLPYNLSALQIDAAKRFGLSAKQVLDLCQQLYERHKLITYPRSDCRYLPVQHFQEVGKVTHAIATNCTGLGDAVTHANLKQRGRAWNDARVTAHHAIIPTERQLDTAKLDRRELQLYELIARQYLMQFYDAWCYRDTRVFLTLSGGQFEARARQVLQPGWKALLPATKKNKADASQVGDVASSGDDKDAPPIQTLPDLKQGDSLLCLQAAVKDKQTQPLKHFTDATLLAAMTGIARFVSDPDTRRILRDTDGLGTEATRAGIIELLFQRQFLQRQGKQIRASEIGNALINSLPEAVATPDMTARWEAQLEAICERQSNYQGFMQPLQQSLQALIVLSQANLPTAFGAVQAPARKWRGKGAKKPKRNRGTTAANGSRAKPGAGKAAGASKAAGTNRAKSASRPKPAAGRGSSSSSQAKSARSGSAA